MDSLDTRLDVLLHRSEAAIGDDGFSESVMHALPAKRFAGPKARRWTLGGAAAAGGLLTVLIGPPLESAFGSLAAGNGYGTSIVVALVVALVAVPTAWAFYSE